MRGIHGRSAADIDMEGAAEEEEEQEVEDEQDEDIAAPLEKEYKEALKEPARGTRVSCDEESALLLFTAPVGKIGESGGVGIGEGAGVI